MSLKYEPVSDLFVGLVSFAREVGGGARERQEERRTAAPLPNLRLIDVMYQSILIGTPGTPPPGLPPCLPREAQEERRTPAPLPVSVWGRRRERARKSVCERESI